jgi:hypothetical protein
MQIEKTDEQWRKQDAPIRNNVEAGSNVTVERDWQPAKHLSSRVSTDKGTQIEKNDADLLTVNALIRSSLTFDSNVGVKRD